MIAGDHQQSHFQFHYEFPRKASPRTLLWLSIALGGHATKQTHTYNILEMARRRVKYVRVRGDVEPTTASAESAKQKKNECPALAACYEPGASLAIMRTTPAKNKLTTNAPSMLRRGSWFIAARPNIEGAIFVNLFVAGVGGM